MSKFKVGDKVVRTVESKTFWLIQGVKNYYIVTDVGAGGYWLQLDGVRDKEDTCPWYAPNFELYKEPEDDELPPVPKSVLYVGIQEMRRTLLVRPYNNVTLGSKALDLYITGERAADGKSCSLTPDMALQLAHDLRRMAMEIKRKEKANEGC